MQPEQGLTISVPGELQMPGEGVDIRFHGSLEKAQYEIDDFGNGRS